MSSNQNYTEWTQEQKDEFAQKRMDEMKLKNDKLKKRHAEVEFDRIAAEKKNSAVTNTSKAIKKDTNYSKNESYAIQKKTEYQREWDVGKPANDASPEHHFPVRNVKTGNNRRNYDYMHKTSFDSRSDNRNTWQRDSSNRRNYEPTRRTTYDTKSDNRNTWQRESAGHRYKAVSDRRDSRDRFPRNKNSDSFRYGSTSDNLMKPKRESRHKHYENQYSTSHHYRSPEKRRNYGNRNNEYNRKPHAYSEEKYKRFDSNKPFLKKKFPHRAYSKSTSRSCSDRVDNAAIMRMSSDRVESLWENDKANEDRNKLTRTENWVNSVSGRSFKNVNKLHESSEDSSDEIFPEENVASNFTAAGEKKSADCHPPEYPIDHKAEYNVSDGKDTSFSKQFERMKGFKSKRSPQSNSSGKNDHIRKQRRFDRGFRDEGANKFPEFKPTSDTKPKGNSWNNSAVGNKNIRNERSLKNTSNVVKALNDLTLNEGNEDNWGSDIKESHGEDGLWGTSEQSDIKWNLSDDETTNAKSENKVSARKISVSSDKCNENESPWEKKTIEETTKENYKIQEVDSNKDKTATGSDDGWLTESEEAET